MKISDKVILVDAVYTFVIEEGGRFVIFNELFEMLESFSNRKILVTSADDEQFKRFGLGSMPYEVFTLKHNPEKTDPEYFRALLRHFNMEAEQVIYFEHDARAVASAQSVGIVSYLYDDKERDIEDLRNFLNRNI